MIEIRNRFTNEVILKVKTLEGASLWGANLRGANLEGASLRRASLWGANLRGASLEGASLRGASLRGASLEGANLEGANLWGANLEGASLEGANLEGASLEGANLEGANLRGASLEGARGNKNEIKSIHIFKEYDVAYTATHLQIGCKNHAIEDWWGFSAEDIIDMDGDTALLFWQRNKKLIKQIIETNPAKPTGVESNESE